MARDLRDRCWSRRVDLDYAKLVPVFHAHRGDRAGRHDGDVAQYDNEAEFKFYSAGRPVELR